ncbi:MULTISPECIES: Crp/Fnr family transcriptional regulator [unclassified Romboutsia]|uniref:Crp/Fnr family transcriptional regulator n=1 Tax=unclassified Romboutsia TaxID=2626894 RepID=UPI000820D2C4|nr:MULTISPECIES: Crp/Fnr family transcriptional regulator [unclassified Romboutsia]SCH89058.1 cAMP regulatory protein [uncultured Clostridium sp.]
MQESLFYNRIKDKKVKDFINKIPNHIKRQCKLVRFEKGKLIVLKGNSIESVYISCEGNMQVKNEFENGFVYSFANVKPIAYIGVMEIMANQLTYSSTLQTTTECIVIEIPKRDFIKWIQNDQKLTLEILHFVSKTMYDQSLSTGEVLAYPAICTLINYLINVFENEDKNIVFLEKTREEIGSILGFSTRTINRNLKTLKEENLISVSRKGITITKDQFYKLSEKLDSIK